MKRGSDVVAEARKYLGVRFVHQGRTRFGLDCVGLLILIGKNLGLRSPYSPHQIFDVSNYAKKPDGDYLEQMCYRHVIPDPERGIEPGKILLFAIGGHPQHLGVATEEKQDGWRMVHSYERARSMKRTGGFCCESPLGDAWVKRIIGTFYYPGVEY